MLFDGQGKLWRNRTKAALGTTSGDFVHATLAQFQPASGLPSRGISEMSVNDVLAFIEALPTFERRHHRREVGQAKSPPCPNLALQAGSPTISITYRCHSMRCRLA